MSNQKTQVIAEPNRQELTVVREFDAPKELVFQAFSDAEIFAVWMGTEVLHFDFKKNGSYEFATKDPSGNIVFKAGGAFHDFIPNEKIIRTFEMGNAPFSVQIEFLEFENIENGKCKLMMQSIFKSVEHRDNLLKLPFAFGLNMAHNRLQEILNNKK